MSFQRNVCKRNRDGEICSSSKKVVRFTEQNRYEFPALKGLTKSKINRDFTSTGGDWSTERLIHNQDSPEIIPIQLPKKTVISNKSVEKLNWEKRNALMQEIFKTGPFGKKKVIDNTYDDFVDLYDTEDEDEDLYTIDEMEE